MSDSTKLKIAKTAYPDALPTQQEWFDQFSISSRVEKTNGTDRAWYMNRQYNNADGSINPLFRRLIAGLNPE